MNKLKSIIEKCDQDIKYLELYNHYKQVLGEKQVLQKKVEEVENTKDTADTNYQQQLKEKKDKITSLEGNLKESMSANAALEKQCKYHLGEISRCRQKTKDIEEGYKGLQEKLEESEKKVTERDSTIKRLGKENRRLEKAAGSEITARTPRWVYAVITGLTLIAAPAVYRSSIGLYDLCFLKKIEIPASTAQLMDEKSVERSAEFIKIGAEFFKDGDYYSSLIAFNQAYALDKKGLEAGIWCRKTDNIIESQGRSLDEMEEGKNDN